MAIVSADPIMLGVHVGLLATTVANADTVVASMNRLTSGLTERAQENLSLRRAEHEAARQELQASEAAAQAAQAAVENARVALARAQSELSRAESASNSASSDEQSSCAADVSSAAAAVARAEVDLARANQELKAALEWLAYARSAERIAEQRVQIAVDLRSRVQAEAERATFAAARAAVLRDLALAATFLLNIRVDLLNEYHADLPDLVNAAMAGAVASSSIRW